MVKAQNLAALLQHSTLILFTSFPCPIQRLFTSLLLYLFISFHCPIYSLLLLFTLLHSLLLSFTHSFLLKFSKMYEVTMFFIFIINLNLSFCFIIIFIIHFLTFIYNVLRSHQYLRMKSHSKFKHCNHRMSNIHSLVSSIVYPPPFFF